MAPDDPLFTELPLPLTAYSNPAGQPLAQTLATRVDIEPFNAIATGIFVLAILHTFGAARFTALAHRVQHHHDERSRAAGRPVRPNSMAGCSLRLVRLERVYPLCSKS